MEGDQFTKAVFIDSQLRILGETMNGIFFLSILFISGLATLFSLIRPHDTTSQVVTSQDWTDLPFLGQGVGGVCWPAPFMW